MNIYKPFLALLLIVVAQLGWARHIDMPQPGKTNGKTTAEGEPCTATTSQVLLDVNNVRARLLTGGDLWWNPIAQIAQYEVPKVSADEVAKNSIYAGALWIGGIDQLGQLKVAAQTYRQTGNDFWAGPLNANGEAIKEVCNDFDRHFQVTRRDIEDLKALYKGLGGSSINPVSIPQSSVPENILQWPGRNNPYFDKFELPTNKNLAPFYDVDSDGSYDPTKGDYPIIDNTEPDSYADQMIWWMFNDKGDIHTGTGGEAIGLEVGALAFAFVTNDEINSMTFYKYVVNNRSTQPLDSVFFGQWVDPDLGQFDDDFVGCIPKDGLGFVYNGDAVDGEYGSPPPILGVDFFKGPIKKTVTAGGDTIKEQLGMSAFVYYDNLNNSPRGNPDNAAHFYGYMAGVWKDGLPFTYGGNGRGGTVETPYMFPSDPSLPEGSIDPNTGLEVWSECSAGNDPDDRRFLQSSGPFRLEPGDVNEVIVGVVWVQQGLTYPCPSLNILKTADTKAQALFDNNFKTLRGPDAPSLSIRELDKELIITIYNDPLTSNNAFEGYEETDPLLVPITSDSVYRFQGYKIFQLRDGTVSAQEYNDPAAARPVAIMDIKDGVSKIVNFIDNPDVGSLVGTLMVNGVDDGIQHTLRVTQDLFATGDKKLVNYKKYYFAAVAYAYNNYQPVDPNNLAAGGQYKPYLQGNQSSGVLVGMPHIPAPQQNGMVLNAQYGDGPNITRVVGYGNGGNLLEFTDETVAELLANGYVAEPTYKGTTTPIEVTVFDPMRVPDAEFELHIKNRMYVSYSQPKYGTLTQNPDSSFVYTPTNNINILIDSLKISSDFFTYEIANQNAIVEKGVVTIKLATDTELATDIKYMRANDDTEVLYIDKNNDQESEPAEVEIAILANDMIPELVDLEITVENGRYGEAEVLPNNKIKYTRYATATDFFGYDFFEYTIRDVVTDITRKASVAVNVIDTRIPVNKDITEPKYRINAMDDIYDISDNLQAISFNPLQNDINAIWNMSMMNPYSDWVLTNLTSGQVYPSEVSIAQPYAQAIGGWDLNDNSLGFYVRINQTQLPSNLANAVMSASLSYEDIRTTWLNFIADADGISGNNWIRCGEYEGADVAYSDYATSAIGYYDPEQYYEEILGRKIAPYCLANNKTSAGIAPACDDCTGTAANAAPTYTLEDLSSVDIVFSPNPAEWTRCVVVESGASPVLTEGKATKNTLRRQYSRKIDGTADNGGEVSSLTEGEIYYVLGTTAGYITYNTTAGEQQQQSNAFFRASNLSGNGFATFNGAKVVKGTGIGMSYFPGYAFNLKTGERMNIMFAENSFYGSDNGKDMLWNPTSVITQTGSFASRAGGEHFIYVMNSRYDAGAAYQNKLLEQAVTTNVQAAQALKNEVYRDAMWVTIPILQEGFQFKSMTDGFVPTKTTIKLRVNRPYERPNLNTNILSYKFNMKGLAAAKNQTDIAKNALDLVKAVPNPYYAYSQYENSQLDNRVIITNLPPKTNISIFTLDGTLIRVIKTDYSGDTAAGAKADEKLINRVEWDLTNNKNIPIASGMYLIHVEAPDLGVEKTIKWFCVKRPLDLDIF